jgi:DNA repair ATPase RecN
MKLSDDTITEREMLSKKYRTLAAELIAFNDKCRAEMETIGNRLREISQMERDNNAGTGAS